MGTAVRGLGHGLVFLLAFLCFLPVLVPPFLDRIYYRGPPSDHFDGERFFNPGVAPRPLSSSAGYARRWSSGAPRPAWPNRWPVRPGKPPDRVEGMDMRVTWIGHSTVLIQTQSLNILTDPIFSDRASPVAFAGPRRVRAPGVDFADLPRIDLVLVSHAHYDHMDLPTLRRLWRRDRPLIVTSLGNDTILRRAGIEAVARDWGQNVSVRADIGVRIQRNHHWSSRWIIDRNRALWSAFTVRLPGGNLFFGGDTGWGDGSWIEEVAAHRPLRLAILPIGAYEPRDFMRHSHVDPDEAAAIFVRLGAARALGVHWGTFRLTFEGIDDPRRRLGIALARRGIAAGRFVTTEAGVTFDVPTLGAAQAASAGPMRNAQNLWPSGSRK